jgi:hypothetical protein
MHGMEVATKSFGTPNAKPLPAAFFAVFHFNVFTLCLFDFCLLDIHFHFEPNDLFSL